ncbi:MAG: emopamil-binding family protein [Bacteroidota bacterium]
MEQSLPNLPLSQRKGDYFFILIFTVFVFTSIVSDAITGLAIPLSPIHPNFWVRGNYWYAHNCDPLILTPPVWMQFVAGLSAFVYGPFYLLLVYALVKGKNWIRLPAVMYATCITVLTGIVVCGVEFFGEPQWQCQDPAKFLAFNMPYVIAPMMLLVRMRMPLPFTRKW